VATVSPLFASDRSTGSDASCPSSVSVCADDESKQAPPTEGAMRSARQSSIGISTHEQPKRTGPSVDYRSVRLQLRGYEGVPSTALGINGTRHSWSYRHSSRRADECGRPKPQPAVSAPAAVGSDRPGWPNQPQITGMTSALHASAHKGASPSPR